ncbi:fimbrial protein [Rahnella aceris]|uniref:fimbrial protein n=1 Tax=Rahnella sp. (strain Y9602) TaxID=2703885 RepID=UPI00190530ED|nr:fimbrial protein [Rahnella aceris]QQN35999.1 fimbrial protein [Rahnella aceris]
MKNLYAILKKTGSGKMGIRSILAVLLLICGVHNAMALGVCNYPSTFGKVTVDRQITAMQSQPVGSVLATNTYNQLNLLANSCTGDYMLDNIPNLSAFPSSLTNNSIYNSGVTGVGIRVTINYQQVNPVHVVQTKTGDGTTPFYVSNVKVEFVKTGEIVPGKVTTGNLASVVMMDSAGKKDVFKVNIGTVVIKQASCEITGSSAIPVPMGDAKKEDFSGKNSTLPPVDIKIPLQCYADTTVNISFDAQSSLGNGIIDLTKGGAEGVGIQLKLNSKLVEFDKKTFVTKTTQEGAFDIPLTAAYIQTADTIKPGVANAVANFTVTYE